MKTVSSAPSTSVVLTSSTEFRIQVELSWRIFTCTPPGSVRASTSMAFLTPSATSTVLAPETFRTSSATARSPFTYAASRSSSWVSSIRATWPSRTPMPLRVATVTCSKSRGSLIRPCTRTRFSALPRSTRPAGTSLFSRWSALTTMSGDSMRRLITSSASWVSSRRRHPSPRTDSDMIGCWLGSAREITGGSMSLGRSSRMPSILARTSAWASITLVPRLNWTKIIEKPSVDVEFTSFTPCTGFTASSIFLVTSRSTDSGDAPG